MTDTKHKTKKNASHTPKHWTYQEGLKVTIDDDPDETVNCNAIVSSDGNIIGAFTNYDLMPDRANGHLMAAAPKLLAYAECEEAKRLSLLPTDKGGTGNCQSYFEVFNKHGWEGRDIYGFLDLLRCDAIAEAKGPTV